MNHQTEKLSQLRHLLWERTDRLKKILATEASPVLIGPFVWSVFSAGVAYCGASALGEFIGDRRNYHGLCRNCDNPLTTWNDDQYCQECLDKAQAAVEGEQNA